MDRFGLFVDAGYFYAEAGKLLFGTTERPRLNLDFAMATRELARVSAEHSGLPHLRTYWYDATVDAMPTPQHLALAHQKGVKLRLGRFTKYGQKGVDSRVVRDLITLSHNHAVATAYLLSGDEDLREGVVEAQELGVVVVLLGVESRPGDRNQAPTLVRECDDTITLTRDFLSPLFSLREFSLPQLGGGGGDAEAAALGQSFGENWLKTASEEALEEVWADRPTIPMDIDRSLLFHAASHLGPWLSEDKKKDLRAGFWKAIDNAENPEAASEPL
jgi:uncharacterized LabA/DUF88 family protein